MAGHSSGINNKLQYNTRTVMRFILRTVILLLPVTAASPISANPADIALSSLEKRDRYMFNCYSPGRACRGTGDTSGAGESPAGCSPINANGCSQFSFNGGGQWRLTGYLNRQCTGQEIIRVNGGSVTCLQAPGNWAGYIISKI
ncbi:hypothetical protein AFCA_006722 [Aspergillus flavus]|nr:hypothetical protein AFCA_006722 [Aspergillus flavus]